MITRKRSGNCWACGPSSELLTYGLYEMIGFSVAAVKRRRRLVPGKVAPIASSCVHKAANAAVRWGEDCLAIVTRNCSSATSMRAGDLNAA